MKCPAVDVAYWYSTLLDCNSCWFNTLHLLACHTMLLEQAACIAWVVKAWYIVFWTQWIHRFVYVSPGGAGRPPHQCPTRHCFSHVSTHQDLHERGTRQATSIWHDHPHSGEDETPVMEPSTSLKLKHWCTKPWYSDVPNYCLLEKRTTSQWSICIPEKMKCWCIKLLHFLKINEWTSVNEPTAFWRKWNAGR